MSGRIFISYSRKTKITALRIRRDLQLNGITGIFLDLDPIEGIRAGSPWERVLKNHVVGMKELHIRPGVQPPGAYPM